MSNGRRYEIPCVYQIRVKGTFPHGQQVKALEIEEGAVNS